MDHPKDPDRTSTGRDLESSQSKTLPSEERALFDDLFRALDTVVLERSKGGQAFRPIHMVPEWAHSVITRVPDQPSQDLWVARSHFLENKMPDAHRWWDQQEEGELLFGPWEEDGPSKGRLDLEATAIAIGLRKLLVIKRCAPSCRAYKQFMREKRVDLYHRSSES